jgi:hypothetical protein
MRTGYGAAFELVRAHESPFLDEGPDMFHFLHRKAIYQNLYTCKYMYRF